MARRILKLHDSMRPVLALVTLATMPSNEAAFNTLCSLFLLLLLLLLPLLLWLLLVVLLGVLLVLLLLFLLLRNLLFLLMVLSGGADQKVLFLA